MDPKVLIRSGLQCLRKIKEIREADTSNTGVNHHQINQLLEEYNTLA
jgi:hypothetical protein